MGFSGYRAEATAFCWRTPLEPMESLVCCELYACLVKWTNKFRCMITINERAGRGERTCKREGACEIHT